MGTGSRSSRTFDGMYRTHYSDAFEAFTEEKRSINTLRLEKVRKGFLPGSSLQGQPEIVLSNGLPVEEMVLNSGRPMKGPKGMVRNGTVSRTMMPVWDKGKSQWTLGQSPKFDFTAVTFGSQFTVTHPDAPGPVGHFTQASDKIGEAFHYRRAAKADPCDKNVTLTALGDWQTTIHDRPRTSSSGFRGPAPSSPSPRDAHGMSQRPMTADEYTLMNSRGRPRNKQTKTLLTKSLPKEPHSEPRPVAWAGIPTQRMIVPGSTANNRNRFCRGADRVGEDVMQGVEHFNRYETTLRRDHKEVENVLRSQTAPGKPGDPFHPVHVPSDKTQISGDAPGWFAVDRVTVMDKTRAQEKMLQDWNAMDDPDYWMMDDKTIRPKLSYRDGPPPSLKPRGISTASSAGRMSSPNAYGHKNKKAAKGKTTNKQKQHSRSASRPMEKETERARRQLMQYQTGRSLCLGPTFNRQAYSNSLRG